MRKAAAQNPHTRQFEPATQVDDFLLVAVDEFALQLPMLLCGKGPDCSHAAAGMGPGVQQRYRRPCSSKFASRRKARQPCPGNCDAKTVHERAGEQWKCHL
jgi:hypothetical protein